MKNYYCIVLFFLMISSGIFAQVNFEKGHFITENGQKTECFIKNEGWESNPSKFDYKLTLDSDVNVLIEGETTLYAYVDGNIKAFYYKKNDGTITYWT